MQGETRTRLFRAGRGTLLARLWRSSSKGHRRQPRLSACAGCTNGARPVLSLCLHRSVRVAWGRPCPQIVCAAPGIVLLVAAVTAGLSFDSCVLSHAH